MAKHSKTAFAWLCALCVAFAAALGNTCTSELGACPGPQGLAEEEVVDEFSVLQREGRQHSHRKSANGKPRALALFDIDFTLFGVASSLLGTSQPLYSEPFFDSAFDTPGKQDYGKIWGLAQGLVPDIPSFVENKVLGPRSILSTSHPLFGTDSPLDMSFGIVSDGPSLTQYGYSHNGEVSNLTDQILAVRFLRAAADFNPRWHFLSESVYTCNDKFNKTTLETLEGWRLNPMQQGCTIPGNKDRMVQNVLDFYANAGSQKFDYILFADDQKENLQVVKEAPHLGGKYTFGAPFRPREDISTDGVFLAYPSGGTAYEVRPRGDASFPNNCGGCYYLTAEGKQVPPLAGDPVSTGNPATTVPPFQALIAGIGSDNYHSTIGPDGALSGSHPSS